MKRIKLLLIGFALAFSVQAQNTPQGIAYQAVAVKDGSYSVAGENPQSVYWSNKAIKVRFTIFDQYPNGTQSYQEYHETNTDAYGVFNLIIGQGTVISGDFEAIPWELGTAHLQVEIDFNNDNTYTLTSLEKFWSVPYAFFSEQSMSNQTDSAIAVVTDKITYLSNRDRDTVVGNEIQSLAIQGDSLSISGANTVKLNFPANLDNDPGNELQTLSVNGDSLGISNGNTVKLNFPANLDNDPSNELQTLSVKGDSLEISNGNAVKLNFPKNLDNDSTNEIQRIALINDTLVLSNGGGKVPLEAVKAFITNSGGGSGQNGTIPDMWFGVDYNLSGALLWLEADTAYYRVDTFILKKQPSGRVDTAYANKKLNSNNILMRYPYFYVNSNVGHLDSADLKVGNFSSLGQVIDHYGNMIRLNDGDLWRCGGGKCFYEAGDVSFYSRARDAMFSLKNPDKGSRLNIVPQIINDSFILIGARIWKYTKDTLFPTTKTVPVQQGYNPVVIDDHQIIYENKVYISKGTSSGYYRQLKVYDVLTKKSRMVDAGSTSWDPPPLYNFIGISQGKLLFTFGSEYWWLDTKGLYISRFSSANVRVSAELKSRYRRIRLQSGEFTTSNGFPTYSYPNINYSRPTDGITYLHE